MKKILDNSVVVKWFADESETEAALQYLRDFLNGKYTIIIPTLLFYELGNTFISKKVSSAEISEIMQLLQKFPLQIEDIGLAAFRKIYQTAQEYGLSFYDASYVTLMQKYDCELVTADKKLHRKINKSFANVTLLKT